MNRFAKEKQTYMKMEFVQVLEHWIDEEKLELWEIRAYRERLERDKMAAMTRSRTGVVPKGPEKLDPGAEAKRRREEAQKEFAKRHEEQVLPLNRHFHSGS